MYQNRILYLLDWYNDLIKVDQQVIPDTVRRYDVETLKAHLWKRIGQYCSQSVVFKFSTCMYTSGNDG